MQRTVVHTLYLHPSWTSPGSSNNLQLWIDGQYLLEHGNDILRLVGIETEVLEQIVVRPFLVAE